MIIFPSWAFDFIFFFLVTCPSALGSSGDLVLRAACSAWAAVFLMGEERCRGILKVVAFPWLTETRPTASSSKSSWKKGCAGDALQRWSREGGGMCMGVKRAAQNCLHWEIKQWGENKSCLCSLLCSAQQGRAAGLQPGGKVKLLQDLNIYGMGENWAPFLGSTKRQHQSQSLVQCKPVSIWSPLSAHSPAGPSTGFANPLELHPTAPPYAWSAV